MILNYFIDLVNINSHILIIPCYFLTDFGFIQFNFHHIVNFPGIITIIAGVVILVVIVATILLLQIITSPDFNIPFIIRVMDSLINFD